MNENEEVLAIDVSYNGLVKKTPITFMWLGVVTSLLYLFKHASFVRNIGQLAI